MHWLHGMQCGVAGVCGCVAQRCVDTNVHGLAVQWVARPNHVSSKAPCLGARLGATVCSARLWDTHDCKLRSRCAGKLVQVRHVLCCIASIECAPALCKVHMLLQCAYAFAVYQCTCDQYSSPLLKFSSVSDRIFGSACSACFWSFQPQPVDTGQAS